MIYDNHEENRREVDGFILQRTDPYGLWVILDQKGKLDKNFKGQSFTSARLAADAVKVFLKRK